jgi:hypothetical protein
MTGLLPFIRLRLFIGMMLRVHFFVQNGRKFPFPACQTVDVC